MGTGYVRPLEMEPDMEFRRRVGGGEMTFDHAEDRGIYSGKRWVQVYTKEGHSFPLEWDAQLILVEDQWS